MRIVQTGASPITGQFPPAQPGGPARWNRTRSPDRVRRLFEEAVRLADGGEAVHAPDDLWPHGLADHLILMLDDLEDHELREDAALSLRSTARDEGRVSGGDGRLAGQLGELTVLARGFRAPPHADGGWRRLYRLCRALDRLLRERMTLEARRAN